MPLEGRAQLFGRDALAVVRHPQEGDAALAGLDRDLAGVGVEGVLDQLFGDGGGPFDHLAGGDAGGLFGSEHPDGHDETTSGGIVAPEVVCRKRCDWNWLRQPR